MDITITPAAEPITVRLPPDAHHQRVERPLRSAQLPLEEEISISAHTYTRTVCRSEL